MPIYASAGDGQSFEPAPEGGHQAICVDIIDLGWLPNPFKAGTHQHKAVVVWQSSETRGDGQRCLLFKRYTLSLNDKATLRHDLESWRGKAFTLAELAKFDVESVIGANCLLNVQHRVSAASGRTYANVMSVMPLMKGMRKITAKDYERPESLKKLADEAVMDAPLQPESPPPPEFPAATADDDIPF